MSEPKNNPINYEIVANTDEESQYELRLVYNDELRPRSKLINSNIESGTNIGFVDKMCSFYSSSELNFCFK